MTDIQVGDLVTFKHGHSDVWRVDSIFTIDDPVRSAGLTDPTDPKHGTAAPLTALTGIRKTR